MALDDAVFQTLLQQVRELHERTNQMSRSRSRIHENIRARLSWNVAPALPDDQRNLADEVVSALDTQRLSSSQSRQLYEAYFRR